MKILKDNYTTNTNFNSGKVEVESYPRKIICEQCGSELEYKKSDIITGALGCSCLNCPLCKYVNFLDDEEGVILTIDNIEFPIHFWHTSKEDGAADKCNTDEIRKELKNAIEYFRKNKDEFAYPYWSGNLFMLVLKYSGDKIYEVYISNDFYNSDIPFQSEDYWF